MVQSEGNVMVKLRLNNASSSLSFSFFQHTMSSHKLRSIDPTTIILSMATIVKSIREAHGRRRMSTYHQALQSVLQDSNPFGQFANAADSKVITFDARYMSNIAELLERQHQFNKANLT